MSDFPAVAGLMDEPGRLMGGPLTDAMLITLNAATAAAIFPAANKAIYLPYYVLETVTIAKMACYNGSVINGNVDIGIYNEQGVKLVSSGSTAHAGASLPQIFDITDTVLVPGTYFLALSTSSATATFIRTALSVTLAQACGAREQATAFPLPATATFAATTGYCPVIAASHLTVF